MVVTAPRKTGKSQAYIDKLSAEITRLRNVLAIYADPANWRSEHPVFYETAEDNEGSCNADFGIPIVWAYDDNGPALAAQALQK
jgi:hypothetical protein